MNIDEFLSSLLGGAELNPNADQLDFPDDGSSSMLGGAGGALVPRRPKPLCPAGAGSVRLPRRRFKKPEDEYRTTPELELVGR